MSRLLPAIVAVLAPVLLVGSVLAYLARPEPVADEALPADVAAVAARIENGADLVVLGNSKVDTDLDLAALADAAGFPPERAVKLNLDGTNAPIWYAVLKRRVYDQGHRPKVVVVYSTLAMMVQVELLSDSLNAQLARHIGAPDPAIDEKVHGKARGNPTWERVLNRRTEAHAALFDGLRNAFVGLVFAPPGEGTLTERGAAVAEPALATVFNSDAMRDIERVRAVPVAEQATGASAAEPVALDADATMIPDLIELAKAHGSEIVFVRAPMGSLKHGHDLVPRALEESVVQRMGALGAAWIDLSQDGPPDSGYGDGSHMNRSGRTRFMPKVLAALKEVGFGGGGPLVAASVLPARPPPVVTRVGTPPDVPAKPPIRGKLGCDYHILVPALQPLADNVLTDTNRGAISPLVVYEDGKPLRAHAAPKEVQDQCTGAATHWNGAVKFTPTGDDPEAGRSRDYRVAYDPAAPLVGGRGEEAWWVYPGTALRFAFAEGSVAGNVAAAVAGVAILPGEGAPTVRFGAAEAPLVRAGDGLAAAVHADVAGAFTVEIASPPDGPTLLLDRLALRAGDDAWYVLGTAPREVTVDVLLQPVTFAAPPRTLAQPTKPPTEAPWKKGTWVFPVGDLGVPPLEETAKLGATCSALRLSIDGQPAERQADGAPPNTPVATVTHSKDRLLVRFQDPAEPAGGPERFGYHLDPERKCGKHARWVGPGDDARFTIPPDAHAGLRHAGTTLHLTGGAFYAKPEDEVAVSVTADGATLLDRTLPLTALADAPADLPLDAPLPADAAVEVRIRSTGWLLLTYAQLAEAPPDVFAALP